ncbi:MAG: hypothetical protein ABI609_05290 [Acidobacteriota bacterium]
MARPEHVQQLDRQVAAAVERAVRGMREQFGGRLRQASDELLKLLQESTPDVPQSFIHEDDLSPIVATARAEGRADGVREMHSGFSRIDRAQTQSEALEALLQAATLFASRAALFLTRPEGAHGWAGFGFGESAATLSTVEISYADAAWARLAEGRGSVELDAADCARLCGRLEASAPRDGVLIPLVLRDQVAAALYADRLTEASRLDIEALQALTQSTALAIETLPFRNRASTPTLRLAEASAPALGLWRPDLTPPEDMAAQSTPWAAPVEENAPAEGIEEAAEDLHAEPDALSAAAGFSFSEPAKPIQPESALSWSAFTPEPLPEVAEVAEPAFLSTAPLPVETESDLFEPADPVELAAATFAQPTQPAEAVADEVWVLEADGAPAEPEAMELVGGFDLPTPAAPAPEAIAWIPEPEPELLEPLPAAAPANTQMFTLEPSAAAVPPTSVFSAPPETTAAIDLSDDQTLLLERRSRTQEPALSGPSTQEMQLPGVSPEVAGDDDTHPGMHRGSGKIDAPARGPERATTWQPGVTSEVRPPADLAGPGWAFATTRVAAAVAAPGEESLHEEARRLARLLVSEIKLYNEEQVEEGRRSRDIYERLKEDIDRSRQMYEERVDERVRNKTDYFYQELVRILAAGDAKTLGI